MDSSSLNKKRCQKILLVGQGSQIFYSFQKKQNFKSIQCLSLKKKRKYVI